MSMSYPWRRQAVPVEQQRRERRTVRLAPYPCVAMLYGETPCGKPASVLDKERGGLICWSCYVADGGTEEERKRRYVVPFAESLWKVDIE